MRAPNSPLTADLAVRITAEMVCQIVNGLRPRESDPLRFQRVVVAIGRAAQVDLAEIREADAANERFIAAEKAEGKATSGNGGSLGK